VLNLDKLFSRLTTITVILMGIVFVGFVSQAWIRSLERGDHSYPPIEIYGATLESSVVPQAGTLDLIVNGHTSDKSCEYVYVLGSLVDKDNKIVYLDKIINVNPSNLESVVGGGAPLLIGLPNSFPPNHYQLRTEFHMLCSGRSYIGIVPLVPFLVIAK
jgi:hypothetical protein